MMLLILGLLIGGSTGFLWFSILLSDPTDSQMSKDAANRVLMIGLPIAALFLIGWWFKW